MNGVKKHNRMLYSMIRNPYSLLPYKKSKKTHSHIREQQKKNNLWNHSFDSFRWLLTLTGGRVHTLRIDMEVQLSANSNIYTLVIIITFDVNHLVYLLCYFVFGSIRVSPMANHLRTCTYWVVNDSVTIIIAWR